MTDMRPASIRAAAKATASAAASAALALALGGAFGASAWAQEPLVTGEINSYTRMAAFTEPYRRGWTLALEEINAAGGVDGRPIEVISRDDDGRPGDAVRIAQELVEEEDVVLLWGAFLSNVGLAISNYADRRGVLFIAAEPLADSLTLQNGNRHTYRLRPSTGMQARMLAEEAALLPAVRWATVAPNYAYGQEAVENFQEALLALRPDVEFVEAQWPPLFAIDAGSTVRAVAAAEPDAIFNVTFGADLAQFAREGALRGLFDDTPVVSLLTGEPEYLDPLGADAPEGWIVTGYPAYDLADDPLHAAFHAAYVARWDREPSAGSIVGYNTMLAVAAVLSEAESFETEDLLAAMEDLTFESPVGAITFRALDNQATMGAWVGRTALRDGRGVMVDWRYADGADYLTPEAVVEERRPSE